MKYQSIYDYVIQQETAYALPITVIEGYNWNMKTHIRETVLYKNSELVSGKNKGLHNEKPVKNIMRPILNLQYRNEGFDVKDIELFVNESKNYFKSFLIKKFHENWARKNKIDTFIDEVVESYVDFGGVLVKNVKGIRPEVVQLQSLAFCDQTNLLAGPFAIKHFMSPSEIKEMKNWERVDEVITLAENKKVLDRQSGKSNKTPGKYIEVYEIHGDLPKFFLTDQEGDEYVSQLQIITFYTDSKGERRGITLFRGEEPKPIFKFLARDPIFGRALGFGGAEELFEPQVWVNYDMIRMKEMLDAASKIIFKTTDSAVAARHPSGLKDLDNLELVEVAEGKDIVQLDTLPRSINLFDRSITEWESHAQQMGGASNALMGKHPSSGTAARLQELVLATSQGQHDYRRGKLAVFMDEIYQDWIIPHLVKEVNKGQEWIADLDMEELQAIADNLVTIEANRKIAEKTLNWEIVYPQDLEQHKQQVRQEFLKGNNKRFIKIIEDEFKDAPVSIKINVAGKQYDLATKVSKLTSIFGQIISNPQILQNPVMGRLFNQILEASGLDPLNYHAVSQQGPLVPPPTPAAVSTPQPALT